MSIFAKKKHASSSWSKYSRRRQERVKGQNFSTTTEPTE